MPRTNVPPASPTLADGARLFRYHLDGQRYSPRTVSLYLAAIEALGAYLAGEGKSTALDRIDKRTVQPFIYGMARKDGAPASPAYVSTIYRSLSSFFAWAINEGDLGVTANPMSGWKPAAVTAPSVKFPDQDQQRAMIAGCKRSRSFLDARDEAILRLFIDTGIRLSELTSLTVGSIDFEERLVHVIGKRTKGKERPRVAPFGPKTAAALDRYVNRFRPGHFRAVTTDALWLGRSGPMTPNGVAQMVAERGIAAKVPFRVHPHMLRHAWVDTSLRAGMQEGDVMRITGHTSRSLLDRYGAYGATTRALDAYRRIARPEV